LFETAKLPRRHVLPRTDSHHALKRALQVELTDTRLRREFSEFHRLVFLRRIEQPANTLHEFDLPIDDALDTWLATQTRTKTCLFSGIGNVEKRNSIASRASRRA
jgi:hypothetical protein